MAFQRRREHCIFTDSRGSGLYKKIKGRGYGEFIGVWKKSGATFMNLVELAETHLDSYPFDVVYVAGGVNDITTKNQDTGKISFDWAPPECLIEHLLTVLKRENARLAQNFPASKIIFCPLVGQDLGKVVNAHAVTQL